MTTEAAPTEAVMQHHLEALTLLATAPARAVEEIMQDYAPDALLFTPQGVLEGAEAIRGFMESMAPLFSELMGSLEMQIKEIRGEIAYQCLTAGDRMPLGTDTFIVRGGKIVAQTFAAYMPA